MVHQARQDIGDLTPNNINQFKRLHSVLFPVQYSPKFYKDALASGELSKLAYFSDIPVGCYSAKKDSDDSVYLATFGVLAPYRKLGLGSLMLEYLLKAVKEMSGVKRIDLHVSVDNEGAKEFYTKRGFEVVETVENYYKGKQDSRAYLLRFKISSE